MTVYAWCYAEDTLSTEGRPIRSLTTGGAHEEMQRLLEKTRRGRRSDQTTERLQESQGKTWMRQDTLYCVE